MSALIIFLRKVDNTFPVPLSSKQDLDEFAQKLLQRGTLCAEFENDEIVSLVAGYTENVVENMGYISVVATLGTARGKGYASKLIKRFLEISKQKSLAAVHLYTNEENLPAVKMYNEIGFQKWVKPCEARPHDLHLIYYN